MSAIPSQTTVTIEFEDGRRFAVTAQTVTLDVENDYARSLEAFPEYLHVGRSATIRFDKVIRIDAGVTP